MSDSSTLFDLENETPPFVGSVCSEFVVIQFEGDDHFVERAHTLCLRFGESWFMLFFESTLAFCIQTKVPPSAFGESISISRLTEVVGRLAAFRPSLAACIREETEEAVAIVLEFDCALTITMRKLRGEAAAELHIRLS